MGYKMKGFSGFGNSPVKQNKTTLDIKPGSTADKKHKEFLKEQREEEVHAMDYLTKTPVGPVAEVKEDKKEDDVHLSPGFEDPIKIQKVQREGLIPGSQKFTDKAFLKSQKEEEVKRSDLDEKGKAIWDKHREKKK